MRLPYVAAFLGLAALQPASGQTLMSCEVIGSRGSGENTEIIYNERNCRPVTSLEVLRQVGGPTGTQTVYGQREQAAAGGGPVYVLRFVDQSQGPVIHYGAPLDGNPGTVGR